MLTYQNVASLLSSINVCNDSWLRFEFTCRLVYSYSPVSDRNLRFGYINSQWKRGVCVEPNRESSDRSFGLTFWWAKWQSRTSASKGLHYMPTPPTLADISILHSNWVRILTEKYNLYEYIVFLNIEKVVYLVNFSSLTRTIGNYALGKQQHIKSIVSPFWEKLDSVWVKRKEKLKNYPSKWHRMARVRERHQPIKA